MGVTIGNGDTVRCAHREGAIHAARMCARCRAYSLLNVPGMTTIAGEGVTPLGDKFKRSHRFEALTECERTP